MITLNSVISITAASKLNSYVLLIYSLRKHTDNPGSVVLTDYPLRSAISLALIDELCDTERVDGGTTAGGQKTVNINPETLHTCVKTKDSKFQYKWLSQEVL